MANRWSYNKSLSGGLQPMILSLPVAVGSSTTFSRGVLCELESATMSPLDSDQSMAGILAISVEEWNTSRVAGFANFLIPRPGDVFDVNLETAGNPTRGADLYWSSSVLVKETGSNIIGNVVDHSGYPQKQGNPDVGDVADRGTTVRDTILVHATIRAAASYYIALQK